MSNLWPKFTKEYPCPACKHWDWTCRFGEKYFVCERVPSEYPHKNGGWLHVLDGNKPSYVPLPRYSAPPLNCKPLLNKFSSQTSQQQLNQLSTKLGVSPQSLSELGTVFCDEYDAYGFPMSDGEGEPIGIRLRNEQGEKWAVKGSKSGIFLPTFEQETDILFVCEGPTDTAALLTMGFCAIGKPSCNHGDDLIRQSARRLGFRRVVIVADVDDLKNDRRVGIEAAVALKKKIGMPSVIWLPSPCKDVRQYLVNGGNQRMILSDLRQKTWTI